MLAVEQARAAGVEDGQTVKLLFSAPGFSLTYAWFKSGFPLPRHTHSADCLYYIIAGSLQLGTETLGRGDGFFLPKDMAYAYTPGPEGVEVLEFRTAERFDIHFMAANPAMRAAKTASSYRWRAASGCYSTPATSFSSVSFRRS